MVILLYTLLAVFANPPLQPLQDSAPARTSFRHQKIISFACSSTENTAQLYVPLVDSEAYEKRTMLVILTLLSPNTHTAKTA